MLKPLGHRVLLKPCNLETETEGGLIVNYGEDQRLRERQQQLAKIVDIGPDAWKAYRKIDENGKEIDGQNWAQIGDLIYCARMAGSHYIDPYDGREWMLVNDEDIQLVVSEGDMPEVAIPVFKLKVNS